jgi:hypothetical protein
MGPCVNERRHGSAARAHRRKGPQQYILLRLPDTRVCLGVHFCEAELKLARGPLRLRRRSLHRSALRLRLRLRQRLALVPRHPGGDKTTERLHVLLRVPCMAPCALGRAHTPARWASAQPRRTAPRGTLRVVVSLTRLQPAGAVVRDSAHHRVELALLLSQLRLGAPPRHRRCRPLLAAHATRRIDPALGAAGGVRLRRRERRRSSTRAHRQH